MKKTQAKTQADYISSILSHSIGLRWALERAAKYKLPKKAAKEVAQVIQGLELINEWAEGAKLAGKVTGGKT